LPLFTDHFDESVLDDAARSAFEEAMGFGVSLDNFTRLARHVHKKTVEGLRVHEAADRARRVKAEPVAYALKWPSDNRINLSTVYDTKDEAVIYAERCVTRGITIVPLFATPQPAPVASEAVQPLTDAQIVQIGHSPEAKFANGSFSIGRFARAIEAAHGIGKETP